MNTYPVRTHIFLGLGVPVSIYVKNKFSNLSVVFSTVLWAYSLSFILFSYMLLDVLFCIPHSLFFIGVHLRDTLVISPDDLCRTWQSLLHLFCISKVYMSLVFVNSLTIVFSISLRLVLYKKVCWCICLSLCSHIGAPDVLSYYKI